MGHKGKSQSKAVADLGLDVITEKLEAIENMLDICATGDTVAIALLEGLRVNQVVQLTVKIEDVAGKIRGTLAAKPAELDTSRQQWLVALNDLVDLLGEACH